jgi:hypothetical protein
MPVGAPNRLTRRDIAGGGIDSAVLSGYRRLPTARGRPSTLRYAPRVQVPSASPTVVDWMSAVGEVAGAAATFAAVVVALSVARRSRRAELAEQADRRAGQARLVTAHLHRADGRWWVRTTNDSTAPVFDVEVVEVRHTNGVSTVESVPGAPAGLGKLPAGQEVDRAVSLDDPASAVIVLRFLDAAGLRWHREGAAQPRRIVDEVQITQPDPQPARRR